MFNSNQLYTQQSQTIKCCDYSPSTFDGLTKLSLFNIRETKFDSKAEEQFFVSLLASFGKTLYFRKKEVGNFICWDVFANNEKLATWLNEKIDESRFDFLLWPDEHLYPPKLLVFDMDSTFIQIEVIDELARLHGVGDSVSQVTEAAMRGELDFAESLISRVACLQGLAESTIDDIANKLPLSPGVAKLVAQSNNYEVKVAIVSGGFIPFVQRLKDTMGLFEVKANALEITDKKLTGKVLGNIVDARVKADFVNELREKLKINKNEILTIGDGANDLLMMKESGFSLAYRAKPAVQAKAKGRMNLTHLNHLADIFGW